MSDALQTEIDAILTEMRIESDVARALTAVPSTVFAARVARQFRDALYADDSALRKLDLPPGVQAAVNAVLVDDITYLTGLDRLVFLTDPAQIHAGLLALGPDAGTPAPIDRTPSVKALRAAAGLPDQPDLLTSQPAGTPVYAEDFSTPGSFVPVAGASVEGGHLTVSTHGATVVSPAGKHAYDGSHVSVQATFTAAAGGSGSYGLSCPHVANQNEILALVSSTGAVSIVSQPVGGQGAIALYASGPTGAPGGAVQTVRLDCEQYASDYGVVRVFVNGTAVAGLGVPAAFPSDMAAADSAEPALAVVAGSGPATVGVDHFSVASLPAVPGPPVPIPSA